MIIPNWMESHNPFHGSKPFQTTNQWFIDDLPIKNEDFPEISPTFPRDPHSSSGVLAETVGIHGDQLTWRMVILGMPKKTNITYPLVN